MNILELRVVNLKQEMGTRVLKISGNKTDGKQLTITNFFKRVERLQSATKIHVRDPVVQTKQIAKRRKLNHDETEQSSIIFKIPIEMIEYIFDYLDLKDLSAVSATCKRMQQLAGQVYQQSYSGLLPVFNRSQGVWEVKNHRLDHNRVIDFKYFVPFVDKMYSVRNEGLDYLNSSSSNFNQLSKLTISAVNFNCNKIDAMKVVLNKLEYLNIRYCSMYGTTFEHLFSSAPNLKRLCITDYDFRQTWLECFPTLEHLEFSLCYESVPIKKILEVNPNIRKFGIDAKYLWENRSELKSAEDVKLEDLSIEIAHSDYKEIQFSFWKLLNELHQRGIYKRLNLCYLRMGFDQNIVDRIANVTAVNRLYVSGTSYLNYVALSGLEHLEDITFPDSRYIIDIKTVATRLKKLKCIHFGKSNTSHVKLFMSRSSKLERIQIDWFMDEVGNFEDEKVLNLFELNKERVKLSNVKKITLFVQESVYLVTKRANRETDLNFIKLKRTDSLDGREFDFKYPEIYFPYGNKI